MQIRGETPERVITEIKIGDYVLVKQEKKNKLSVNFNQKPYKVIKRTGVEISAQSNDGHIITRNISQDHQIDMVLHIHHS